MEASLRLRAKDYAAHDRWLVNLQDVITGGSTLSVDLQEPAYKNPRLALWSASKSGLGWLGLTLARASKNIQASLGWRKKRGR